MTLTDFVFALILGIYFGFVGTLIQQTVSGIVVGVLLAAVYGAYVLVLPRRDGLLSGVMTGCVMGTAVSLLSLWAAGTADTVSAGILFGIMRGAVVGAVVGAMTHAVPDPVDPWFTRLFLYGGSVGVGVLLGVGVGLVSGAVIGAIRQSALGILWATLLGAVVGGYFASYYRRRRIFLLGAAAGAAVSLLSFGAGGAMVGIVLGLVSGAFAPMLLVAFIGAYGGLSSRGVRAMIIEAVEAPGEMMRQGAVPFLAPCMVIGLIVGTAAAGRSMLLALPATLALLGLALGVLGEIEGKAENRITARLIVEMLILSADEWPIGRIIRRVTASEWRWTALRGLAVAAITSGCGAVAGMWIGQQLTSF